MLRKRMLIQLKGEDWVIVYAGMIMLAIAVLFPQYMPVMPKNFSEISALWNVLGMYALLMAVTLFTAKLLDRPMKGVVVSLSAIFALAIVSQLIAGIGIIAKYGFESVFFSVIIGLLISNFMKVPEWLKPAINSEFYIKIGIIALGSTIIFSEVIKAGIFGLAQAFIVVFVVWYFAFWIARKVYKVEDDMATMLASAVSICGVSAAIATCGAINGDNKKLSYVISLVLVVAIPMMYIMPWLASIMGLSQEVAGAWMGGTIDTTGAVAASGTLIGEQAAKTAIIVKSSQNVLLGVAAFIISLFWSLKSSDSSQKAPTWFTIWDRFPKFVVGFMIASLVFSFCIDFSYAKEVGKITKGFSTTLFSVAFICIGLETRFKDIFNKENNRPLKAFLVAQAFNIVVTLIVSYILFGIVFNADLAGLF